MQEGKRITRKRDTLKRGVKGVDFDNLVLARKNDKSLLRRRTDMG